MPETDERYLGPTTPPLVVVLSGPSGVGKDAVLQRMLELEDFNKAVELLRVIIDLQEKLGEQTGRRRQQKLRELLED